MPVLGSVARNEIVQVVALEWLRLQREVHVGPEVVDPEASGPRRLARGLPVKEQDVRLYPLRVEDTRRQAQKGVHIALVEELPPYGLARAALEKHVVGDDDGRAAVDLEQRLHVLDEVELLVGGGRPEVVAHHRQRLTLLLTFLVNNQHARLLTE